MLDVAAQTEIEIPKRALFRAAEVCDLVKLQPYVLRSWESEFPALGVAKTTGGTRVYRRTDVEQVIRIKHLLLVEGLTLAGARRRLEEEAAPVGADEPAIDELIGQNARERLTEVKRGLRSILELLARNAASGGSGIGGNDVREFRLVPQIVARPAAQGKAAAARVKAAPKAKARPRRRT